MEIKQSSRHPAIRIIIFLCFFVSGLFLSQFLVLLILYPFLGNEVLKLGNVVANPAAYPEYKGVLLFFQGFTSFVAMIAASFIFMNYFYKNRLAFFRSVPGESFFLYTGLLVIVSMPANAWIAEQNMNMQLPDFLKWFENWALIKENELKVLTEYLTTFTTNSQFLFGLVVIALIPAIGEELMFRGIIQNNLQEWFKNKHAAVWVAGILFSAIHFQFYGFFPRMLLGVLFGYLYLWTGNMLIPITGHFVNNGFTLFLLHMKNQNKIKMDLETTKDMPMGIIIGSVILFTALLVLFKIQADKKRQVINPA